MAIVQNINLYQFRDAFRNMNRGSTFSYEGLEVLFDYLENYSDETGEPVELDVVALCCDYAESSTQELIEAYGDYFDVSDAADDEDEIKSIVEEFLQQNTIVCGEVSGGFVYAAF